MRVQDFQPQISTINNGVFLIAPSPFYCPCFLVHPKATTIVYLRSTLPSDTTADQRQLRKCRERRTCRDRRTSRITLHLRELIYEVSVHCWRLGSLLIETKDQLAVQNAEFCF